MPQTPLLYEDDELVAVDKAPGEPVIPAREGPLEACLQKRLEVERGERLFVVHRIDRLASGVVVFARHPQAHRRLSLAFENRQVHKSYWAFVSGVLLPLKGHLDVPLHTARKGKMRPARPGERGQLASATDYETRRIWRFGGEKASLVEARPFTGRHHQIRVHLRSAEAPILFDPLYGRGYEPHAVGDAPCQRLALHARRIELPGREGGPALALEAPLARDLASLAAWMDERGRVEEPPW
jgi:RluA family pseudouridine synthase